MARFRIPGQQIQPDHWAVVPARTIRGSSVARRGQPRWGQQIAGKAELISKPFLMLGLTIVLLAGWTGNGQAQGGSQDESAAPFHILAPDIPLTTGWNWVSFQDWPVDSSLDAVFAGVLGQIGQVKTQVQTALRLGSGWVGDLTDMGGIEDGVMYKVRVSGATSLPVDGEIIQADSPVVLIAGWNWVAYRPFTVQPIGSALASLGDSAQQAKGQTASAVRVGTSWLGDLRDLDPGQGYAVLTSSVATLVYPLDE